MINRIRNVVMTSLIVALVAGCGGETKAKTFKVTGRIHSGGNPITGLPPGEKPMVKFEAKANKEQSQAKVAEDGAFSADLVPGDYTVTGSAGFMANEKGSGMVSKSLKVEADVAGLDLDIGKAKAKAKAKAK